MGKNMANPIATILSACMMLEYLLKNNQSANEAAQLIDNAIEYGFKKICYVPMNLWIWEQFKLPKKY